jgi:hypothetical protein
MYLISLPIPQAVLHCTKTQQTEGGPYRAKVLRRGQVFQSERSVVVFGDNELGGGPTP